LADDVVPEVSDIHTAGLAWGCRAGANFQFNAVIDLQIPLVLNVILVDEDAAGVVSSFGKKPTLFGHKCHYCVIGHKRSSILLREATGTAPGLLLPPADNLWRGVTGEMASVLPSEPSDGSLPKHPFKDYPLDGPERGEQRYPH